MKVKTVFIVLFVFFIAFEAQAVPNDGGLLDESECLIRNLKAQIKEQCEAGAIDSGAHKKSIVHDKITGSDKQLIARGLAIVMKSLKDPYSAKFKNVYIGKGPERIVHGEVNAKNGFGGYTGYDAFTFDPEKDSVTFESELVDLSRRYKKIMNELQ